MMCRTLLRAAGALLALALVACSDEEEEQRLPPAPEKYLRGLVLAPAGQSIVGTRVVACFVSNNQCDLQSNNTRSRSVQGTGSSGLFVFEDLADGLYVLSAYKDNNFNNELDAGDYEGVHPIDSDVAVPVAPPAAGLNIQLRQRRTDNTPPPGVTFLRPSDFVGGSATVTLQGLSPSERVVVIPVHASQSPTVDGLDFVINTTGVAAQTLAAPVVAALPRPGSPSTGASSEPGAQAHRRAHLEQLSGQHQDLERLRNAGIRPLGASRAVRSSALDNCPGPYTVDVRTCDFWVNSVNNSQRRITATLKHVSSNAYWFVQNEDLGDYSTNDLRGLADLFEARVIPSNRQYFGDFNDVDGNQRIIIVFSRLLSPLGLLGYVSAVDYFDDGEAFPALGVHSNEGDIFYAATPTSLNMPRAQYFDVVIPATMVHELKHLISAGRRILAGHPLEEVWIEEGSAMGAQQLAGMGSQIRGVQDYAEFSLAAPHDFRVVYAGRPSGREEGLSIYGYNFLFVWRVAQARGHASFWNSWTLGPGSGIANLQTHAGRSFPEMMLDWAAALALDHANLVTGYDYDTFNLRDGSWTRLGYRPLQSSVSGTARSMAYFVGRGTGSDASITVQVTNSAAPHAVILRLPAALP